MIEVTHVTDLSYLLKKWRLVTVYNILNDLKFWVVQINYFYASYNMIFELELYDS
jgi:hypothetical protein